MAKEKEGAEIKKEKSGGPGKLEKRILYELDRDASQTLGEIGKKIRKSPQYVEYWLKKFVDEKQIDKFTAVIDYKRLGYTNYFIYLSFRAMPPKKEEEFFAYLLKEKQVTVIYRCYGIWDAVFAVQAKDPLELHEILSRVEEKFGDNIGDWTIETHVGSHYFGRNYLSEDFEPKAHTPFTGGKAKQEEIDNKDMKILSVLKENARASTIELAKESGLTPDIVRYRIKKLRERNILLGASILPDYSNYPFIFYRILFNIGRLSPEKEKALTTFFASKPSAFRLNRTFGRYEMSVDIEVKNMGEFRDMISEIKSRFYDIVISFDYLQVWKVERSCYFVSV